jgi:hypothetical protein
VHVPYCLYTSSPLALQLARSYVDAINGGGMPSIADAWEAAAAAQSARALTAAWDAYTSAMRTAVDLPMDEPKLLAAHESSLEHAVRVFNGVAPSGADSAVERIRAQLRDRASESLASTKVTGVWRLIDCGPVTLMMHLHATFCSVTTRLLQQCTVVGSSEISTGRI